MLSKTRKVFRARIHGTLIDYEYEQLEGAPSNINQGEI